MTTIPCRQCGAPVPEVRHCYATPVCYACLPPPEPLPVLHTPTSLRLAADRAKRLAREQERQAELAAKWAQPRKPNEICADCWGPGCPNCGMPPQ